MEEERPRAREHIKALVRIFTRKERPEGKEPEEP